MQRMSRGRDQWHLIVHRLHSLNNVTARGSNQESFQSRSAIFDAWEKSGSPGNKKFVFFFQILFEKKKIQMSERKKSLQNEKIKTQQKLQQIKWPKNEKIKTWRTWKNNTWTISKKKHLFLRFFVCTTKHWPNTPLFEQSRAGLPKTPKRLPRRSFRPSHLGAILEPSWSIVGLSWAILKACWDISGPDWSNVGVIVASFPVS